MVKLKEKFSLNRLDRCEKGTLPFTARCTFAQNDSALHIFLDMPQHLYYYKTKKVTKFLYIKLLFYY